MTKTIIKIVLTLMTIYFAAIPISVDIGDGHLFNPEWAPHSKVHLVWFLLFTALVAVISIYLLWFRDEILATAFIGLSFNFGFVFAYFTAPYYGGVSPDEASQAFSITDVPPNLAENSILGIIFLSVVVYQLVSRRAFMQ